MPYLVPTPLFDRVLTLLTWAVHEHVQANGTQYQKPAKADHGWETVYDTMQALEQIARLYKDSRPQPYVLVPPSKRSDR